MGDTLKVFGKTWTNVNGIKAYDSNGNIIPYTRGGGGTTLVPKTVTANGTYDPEDDNADGYSEVTVNVPSSGGTYQAKTGIAPTTSSQTITPDSGYDALSSVQINAMPSGVITGPIVITSSSAAISTGTDTISLDTTMPIGATVLTPGYVDSSSSVGTNCHVTLTAGANIRSSSDLTVSDATVNVPAGYYPQAAIATIPNGTEGFPIATKGTVSDHSVSVTPSVTNSAGYIQGMTINGPPITVSASELVDGTYSVTSSGTKDVTNYASASIPAGTVTAPSSISGTSATVSTGTNTLTLTKTVSVTPTVSTAGFVTSGTAGNSSVSLTASVTTQAAQTIHPSTTDQSIAASRYLTGAQTIKAVTMSNLTAANIKKDVVVKIGDSTDDDCVTSITGTYEGGGGSSMNVQVAQSTTRVANTAYTKTASLTCAVSGKYDVYWDCFRSTTSGTSGSQLYIGGSAYGSANTTFSNHAQNNHLTNVTINANQEVAVYVRSRATNYYAYCGQLTIVQTS